MDPIASINIKKDSTFAMMLAAQRRGWELWYLEVSDLFSLGSQVHGRLRRVDVTDDPTCWHRVLAEETRPLSTLDAVLMRKDPPFDQEYVYATWLLEHGKREGAKVFNDPKAIRDHGEKYSIAEFAQFTAPTIVTRDPVKLRAFAEHHGEAVSSCSTAWAAHRFSGRAAMTRTCR
jgi:glutathione synthase